MRLSTVTGRVLLELRHIDFSLIPCRSDKKLRSLSRLSGLISAFSGRCYDRQSSDFTISRSNNRQMFLFINFEWSWVQNHEWKLRVTFILHTYFYFYSIHIIFIVTLKKYFLTIMFYLFYSRKRNSEQKKEAFDLILLEFFCNSVINCY